MKAGTIIEALTLNMYGKIIEYAESDYSSHNIYDNYIINFGRYRTRTLNIKSISIPVETVYECNFCGTIIPWDGYDENYGELWSCEQLFCGKCFCVACFKDKYGVSAWREHINEISVYKDIMCPDCYKE